MYSRCASYTNTIAVDNESIISLMVSVDFGTPFTVTFLETCCDSIMVGNCGGDEIKIEADPRDCNALSVSGTTCVELFVPKIVLKQNGEVVDPCLTRDFVFNIDGLVGSIEGYTIKVVRDGRCFESCLLYTSPSPRDRG